MTSRLQGEVGFAAAGADDVGTPQVAGTSLREAEPPCSPVRMPDDTQFHFAGGWFVTIGAWQWKGVACETGLQALQTVVSQTVLESPLWLRCLPMLRMAHGRLRLDDRLVRGQ